MTFPSRSRTEKYSVSSVFRRGQIHARPVHQPAGASDLRLRDRRRQGSHQAPPKGAAAHPPLDRDDLPGLQSSRAAHCSPERVLPAGDRRVEEKESVERAMASLVVGLADRAKAYPRSSPADRSSASPLPARWQRSPATFSATRRRARSTPRQRSRSSLFSRRSTARWASP